ncbi:MAG TPA: hypothetical protein VHC22_34540 [Pirellulales bacterium]|nr:hypothetical protein [Pirellulales bacterium]
MYHRLPLSPTRVLCWLAISSVIAVATVALIHVAGGNLRPLVELFCCAALGGVLSLLVPHLSSAINPDWLASLGRHSWKMHLKNVGELLLAPRRLQFSVQAGLVYLTVFCLWLGVNVNRGHRCEVAARAVEQAGGRVFFDSPRMLGQVRAVSIARRDGPSDDTTLLGLIPQIHTLRPRRIVVGNKASSTVIAAIQAAFPATDVVIRGGNAPATPSNLQRQ